MSSGFDRLGANVKGKNLDDMVQYVTIKGAKKSRPDWGSDELHQSIATEADAPKPDLSVTLLDSEKTTMSREQAVQMGFTGDSCDHCGSSRMKNTGHCNTCEECGTTTGCS